MNKAGIIACEGIGIGKILVFEEKEIIIKKQEIDSIEEELIKFEKAINKSLIQLDTLYEKSLKKLGAEEAEIFKAHKMICNDIEIIDDCKKNIVNQKVCCEYAYENTMNNFINLFQNMDDDYMKERSLDLMDVKNLVLRNILNIDTIDLSSLSEDTVIVCNDLTPSQTSQLNCCVKGFVTMYGGYTSHSAIIARSLQLPSIVGVNDVLEQFKNGSTIIVDAINNKIVLEPNNEKIKEYNKIKELYEQERKLWKSQHGVKTVLPSKKEIAIAANVATLADLEDAILVKSDGIGLLRTEFLYMQSKELPSLNTQIEFYKKALDAFRDEKVVIRTLDIGGDKQHEYFDVGEELNPFLGVRAIRLCFEYIEVFKTQIKAMLLANTNGNLCIMFPMIATVEEFLKAKKIVNECVLELEDSGFEVCKMYELGTMIEVPAAAILADEFAKHVDFFSIGTNDLIQYTMASDRMNQKLNYLYQPMNLAIQRLIRNVVVEAHKQSKWVGLCGEMAADLDSLKFLASLDIDELSMNTKSILKIKYNISKMSGE